MRLREIIPARTPEEQAEADQVFAFASHRAIKLDPTRVVKARVRCNQLTPTYGVCDFDTFVEGMAGEIERNAKRTLYAHMRRGHPYLTKQDAYNLANRASVALRDIATRGKMVGV